MFFEDMLVYALTP